jgi:hypothetical protein
MDERKLKELLNLLPNKEDVDLSDPSYTGVTNVLRIDQHPLYKSNNYAKVSIDSTLRPHAEEMLRRNEDQPFSEGLVPRLREEATHKPQQTGEAKMHRNLKSPQILPTTRRGRGRPPKEKSDASLTHRFQVMLSQEDIARVQRVQHLAAVDSMGEAIRLAVRNEHERLEIIRKRNGE